MDFFLSSLTSLFTLVNPFAILPVFLSITEGLTQREINQLARRSCTAAAICLIVFALTGNFIFEIFHISISALRVVGGIIFILMGYDMLNARIARLKEHNPDEISELGKMAAITPLAIPMLAGPGAITAVMVLMRDASSLPSRVTLFSAIVIVMTVTYFMLRSSQRILGLLKETGNKVFLRLMGLILMMIAVEFFFRGITPYVQAMLQVTNN